LFVHSCGVCRWHMVNLRIIVHGFRRSLASMRVLNVAEKNEAAKNIAVILGRGRATRREGLSKFNKIYEFPMTLNGTNCSFIMTSVSGHLLNYEFSQCFRSWESCNPLTLFDAPVEKKVTLEFEPIRKTLEREVRSCTHLLIWTDCDREGENIGMEVVDVCRRVKASIQIFRARFSEITPSAINRAVNNLTTIDERVSQAVDARQELDLRIGAAFTRFQTLRLRRVFPRALADQLISYGSCQFPTLGFIVERFREVENFVPEPFWKISVEVIRENGEACAVFQWKRGRLFDMACCTAYYEHLLENSMGRIIHVQQKPKSKWRPLPMDTVEMEKLASRKLRLGVKETMHLAESLYTKGYISYPRTETNSFPPDLKLRSLVETQLQDSRWSDFAQRLLSNGPRPRNGKKSDHAHPPIHPLKAGNTLQGNEARLYELITRHFLACLSEDAKGAETTARFLLGAADNISASHLSSDEGEVFEAKGLVIHQRNYLEIYPYESWSEKYMPVFQLGEILKPDKIEMIEGRTTAPSLLTEADLIALMDKYGIGTDATHAEHIETIKKRLYVGLQDSKFLVPSQLGMGLVEGYDSMDLAVAKPSLRAELEIDLKAICEGRKTKEGTFLHSFLYPAFLEVLQSQLSKYKSAFEMVVRKARKLDIAIGKHLSQDVENIPDFTEDFSHRGLGAGSYQKLLCCPSCGKDVIIRQKSSQDSNTTTGSTLSNRMRWFFSCSGFPDCKYAIWLPDSVTASRVIEPSEQGASTSLSAVSCKPDCPTEGKLVALKFRLGTILPNGYMQEDPDMEYVTCLFCDEEFRMAFGVRIATFVDGSGPSSTAGRQPRSVSQRCSAPRQPNPFQQSQNRNFSTFATSTQHPNILVSQQPPRPFFNVPSSSTSFGGVNSSSRENDDSNPIVCSCGIPARLLTVRKDGPNQGKKFYKCGDTSDVCKFFLWQDSSPGSFTSNAITVSADSGLGSNSGEVVCTCGLPAVRRTVNQATSNRGRQFYVCPNSAPGSSDGCRFFQWADNTASNSSIGASFPRQRGSRGGRSFRGGFQSNSSSITAFGDGIGVDWPPPNPVGRGGSRSRGGGGSVRKCSICQLPGHTRNRCPSAL
uniref:DNA topoisomerase n=1 Tax=Rodentolepis nana TaxID=102285 RepID=A0A0R3TMM9_RODNA